jgi:DNA-binding transcriptional ArsR family regulator
MCTKGYMMHRPSANADVFRAIADPTRRAILARLRQAGQTHVNALAADFAQSRPSISKHLRILNEAGVVSEQHVGRQHLYRIEPDKLRAVDEWIGEFRELWQDNLNRLKAYLEEE